MAEFQLNRIRFTWVGDWVTGTNYTKDDIVRYHGKSYVCLVGHDASADFNTDLNYIDTSTTPDTPAPKWGLWFDGYEWRNNWQVSTLYNLGDIVKYNSYVYICNTSHTSALTPTLGLEADQSKWTVYAATDDWVKNWTISTRYRKDDVVRYGGTMYRCITGHTSAATLTLGLEANIASWTPITYSIDWKTDWVPSTRYKLGDVVKYGGIVYKCTAGHTSAATNILGLEADIGNWSILHNGIDYKANWTVGTKYKINDVVKYGADIWICVGYHVSNSIFDTTNFSMYVPGLEYANAWSPTVSYIHGDVVTYGGYQYYSVSTNNLNNVPSLDSVNWNLLTRNYNIRGEWDLAVFYKVGDVVRRSGYLYVAIADNQGQETTLTSYWQLVNPGMQWKGPWAATNNYVIGDVVSMYSTSYICLVKHTASALNTPGVALTSVSITSATHDGTNVVINFTPQTTNLFPIGTTIVISGVSPSAYNGTFIVSQSSLSSVTIPNNTSSDYVSGGSVVAADTWTYYIRGDQYETLQYQGDIQTFSNGVHAPVSLGVNGNLLKVGSTSGLLPVPSWGNFGTVAKVYYVAGSNGVDAPGYGLTLNAPWKTIKYACANVTGPATIFVKTGTYSESLPISVPAGVAIVGDELRGTTVQPATTINTTATATDAVSGYITVASTANIIDKTPIRFTNASATTIATSTNASGSGITVISSVGMVVGMQITFSGVAFGGLNSGLLPGQVYTILTIPNISTITVTLDGVNPITLTTGTGTMTVNAGNFGSLTSDQLYWVIGSTLNPSVSLTSMINGTTLTQTAASSSVFVVGMSLSGTGVNAGTNITAINTAVMTSATINGSTLSISSMGTGTVAIGMYLTGTGVTPGTYIISGSGSTWTVNQNQTVIPATITGVSYTVSLSQIVASTSITGTLNGFKVSSSRASSTPLTLTTTTNQNINVYGGDVLNDMFWVRNGCGLRNMTFRGLNGILSSSNSYGTRRPLAGSFVSLDPGTGTSDTSVWITTKSPYVQNVTTFGTGAAGLKVDGTLHGGGNRSIVANDFTQVISDGIGAWITGPGALSELVSVFAYYGHCGYLAENGGKIRATNGNTSYGTYGCVAEGFDQSETPLSANVNNRNQQAQIASAFTGEAANKIYRLEYSNAGQGYTTGAYSIVGAGTNAQIMGDEIRDYGIFESRIVNQDISAGGTGYITASNNAQAGTPLYITVASNDQNTLSTYYGMRIMITSGTGVGQYGYVQYYDSVSTKNITPCKESFTPLTATATSSSTNAITVADTSTLYVGMPIMFGPSTSVTFASNTATSSATLSASSIDASGVLTVGTVSGTIIPGMVLSGGTITLNTYITTNLTYSTSATATPNFVSGGTPNQTVFVVSSALNISVGQKVTGTGLSGSVFVQAINGTSITLTGQFSVQASGAYNFYNQSGPGSTWQTSVTGNAQASTTIAAAANLISIGYTSTMWVGQPVTFTGSNIFGGITGGSTYYIALIIGNKIAISTAPGGAVSSVLNANGSMTVTASGVLGGLLASTTYYVIASNLSATTFSVSTSPGGTIVPLSTSTANGSMSVNAVGWDNILPGYPAAALLDSTSVYSIEPRVTFTAPPYSVTSTTLSSAANWAAISYGNNKFIAVSASGATTLSPNGSGWSNGGTISGSGWTDVTYGLNNYVAVASGGTSAARSPDGNAWSGTTLPASGNWSAVNFGNGTFVAVCSGSNNAAYSTDGNTWLASTLPSTAAWTDITFGYTNAASGTWVTVASGPSTAAAYSTNNGQTWTAATLPSSSNWVGVAYGNSRFVAIAAGGTTAAYSLDGITWYSSILPASANWTDISYGQGQFMVVGASTTTALFSSDGVNWTARLLTGSGAWIGCAFGNTSNSPVWIAIQSGGIASGALVNSGATATGRVVVASGKIAQIKIWEPGGNYPTTSSVLSFNGGITDNTLTLSTTIDAQNAPTGIIVGMTISGAKGSVTTGTTVTAINNASFVGYINSNVLTVTSTLSGTVAPGMTISGSGIYTGTYITSGSGNTFLLNYSQTVPSVTMTGVSYTVNKPQYVPFSTLQAYGTPSAVVTVTDPNCTTGVTANCRVAQGVLGNPSWINRGNGYQTSTTTVTVTGGGGFADIYQSSKYLVVSGLSSLPTPGAALNISGNSTQFRIVVINDLGGGIAQFQISPPLSILTAPANGQAISIRQKYSQCRITGHDFLYIGTGNATTTNYPNVDVTTATSYRQIAEFGGGRVFQTSTDQDGNFIVGNLFGVQQASGIVTISADQFSLAGLQQLTLGGFQLGTNTIIVNQFSTDSYFTANSDSIVPTQKAIKTYLARNIAGGGSNAQAGQITAGTVGIGGPNKIFSSTQTQVFIKNSMNITQGRNGTIGGINGTMLAMSFFNSSFSGGAGSDNDR